MKKRALQAAGWFISIALIALMMMKLDLRAMWQGFLSAKWGYLWLAVLINLGVVALKALRWQWLMIPQSKAKYLPVLKMTFIAMAGNNLLPARGGEWLRIYMLGKDQHTSKTALASVLGLDRFFDGASLLIVFALIASRSHFPEWVRAGTYIVTAMMFLLLCVLVALLVHLKVAHPSEHPGRIQSVIFKLAAGASALGKARLAIGSLIVSIVATLMQILTLFCCQLAFQMDASVSTTAMAFIAINLAIIIPSAPSGVGPFEAAAVLTYRWIGYSAVRAFNVALGYHAVQFIPVTLIGLFMWNMRGPSKNVVSSPTADGIEISQAEAK